MSTNIITTEGHEALKKELDHLWRVYRPEITQKVTWAASLGDRSENADYQYNKKLLREIDRRVRYLRKRLEDVKVVAYSPQQEGKVFFGAWVEIENDEGETMKFRIVGYDEIYGRNDYISIDSPMARALLKKEEGDEVVVHTPTGEATWYVNSITYGTGCHQLSRKTANGLAFNALRVPSTPAPPTSNAPASGNSSNHTCGLHCRSKA